MKHVKLNDGKTIIIRAAEKSDAANMLEYIDNISNESDNLTFGPGEFGITLEQEEEFIDNISRQDNSLFIIAEYGGKIVGNLNFSSGKRPRIMHTGEFGVSVLRDYWGKGLGAELIKYLIDWSENNGIVRKINLRVRTDNISAIHLYKKLGFKVEGTITRDLRINDKFYDTLHMGLEID
jgi:RimJ/RimL family protein N-acetyltransferase